MKSGKVLLGAAAGIVAGAVLGLFFAPAKGSAIQKGVARKIAEGTEEVQENLDEYIDATTEGYDTAKKGAMEFVGKAKKKAAAIAGSLRVK